MKPKLNSLDTVCIALSSIGFVVGGSAMVCCEHLVFGGISFGFGTLLGLCLLGVTKGE